MFISISQKENKVGFYIERLDINVYTYEGFCCHMYRQPGAFNDIISQGSCLEWIRDQLKLSEVYESLEAYFSDQHTSLSRMLKMLELSPYSRDLDPQVLEERFESFLQIPLHKRYKETGNLHFRKGDYSSALSWYKSAQAIEKDGEVYNNMGLVYMHYNELAKAYKMLTKAISYSDNISIRMNRVRLLILMERSKEAMDELGQIAQLSTDWQVWYYYGIVHEKMDHSIEALGAYLRCYELSDSEKALKKYVCLEAKHQSLETALRYIEGSKVDQDQKEYLKALVYKEDNDLEGYEQFMEIAIKHSKNATELLLEFALYYVEHSQLIRAIEYIGMITEADQSLEAVVSTKANVAASAGNMREMDKHVSVLLANWKQEVREAVAK